MGRGRNSVGVANFPWSNGGKIINETVILGKEALLAQVSKQLVSARPNAISAIPDRIGHFENFVDFCAFSQKSWFLAANKGAPRVYNNARKFNLRFFITLLTT